MATFDPSEFDPGPTAIQQAAQAEIDRQNGQKPSALGAAAGPGLGIIGAIIGGLTGGPAGAGLGLAAGKAAGSAVAGGNPSMPGMDQLQGAIDLYGKSHAAPAPLTAAADLSDAW